MKLAKIKALPGEISPRDFFLPKEKPKAKWQKAADQLGIFLSALCIVHCVLTPVLLVLLPTLQLFFLREEFHAYLAVIIPVTCLIAFVPGYRAHRRKSVFLWSVAGLAFILAALFAPHGASEIWLESGLSITGGSMLIRAHLLNRRLCRCCEFGHH